MYEYKTIINKFPCDEPILISEIEAIFPERSKPWIDKAIKTMVDNNYIKRFSTGVYYIPRKTIFGESVLSAQKVIEKKYIQNDTDTYGYISGLMLLNKIGLTTQVPNTITLTTNNEASRGRKVTIGNQAVYIMKSNAKITRENYRVLQFLEAIKLVDPAELDYIEKFNLEKYISDNKITLNDISKYSLYFPDYVSKRLLGGALIEKLTQ